MNDFFIKFNEKDDYTMNCSLFLNYFLIYLYVNNFVISQNSQINSQILNENQQKIVKILHTYIKKSMNLVNSKGKNTVSIDQTKKNSIFPMKIDKNEAVSALKKLNNFKRISQSNLQESQRKKSIMKKSKFLKNRDSSFFPKLTSNSNNSIETLEKQQKHVVLTKEDLVPLIKDVKKKIIEEILEKIEGKKEKFANNRVENFNNYQNYLYYSYFNNPLMYDKLLNDYNSRYYSHLLKSFGISDQEYSQKN